VTGAPIDELAAVLAPRDEIHAAACIQALLGAGLPVYRANEPVRPEEGFLPAGAPIQVRAVDLPAARAVLRDAGDASARIDWDEVDVGSRVDNVPLTARRNGMPIPARIAFIVTIIITLLALVAMVVLAVM
jgi:hypothetical protein